MVGSKELRKRLAAIPAIAMALFTQLLRSLESLPAISLITRHIHYICLHEYVSWLA